MIGLVPSTKYSWNNTFWSATPRLPGFKMRRETLTVTKWKRNTFSWEILILFIQSLQSCDTTKEHQLQVRETGPPPTPLFFNLMAFYLLGRERGDRQYTLSKSVQITGNEICIRMENAEWWWLYSSPPPLPLPTSRTDVIEYIF